MWHGRYGCNGHCLTGEAGPCGLNPVWCAPAPTPNDTTSAMPWWSKARTVGFDFFGLLWAPGRRCFASILDCTDTFWGADCAWKVDIPHSGLIGECPGPGGPRGRSLRAFRCVYTNRSMRSSQTHVSVHRARTKYKTREEGLVSRVCE